MREDELLRKKAQRKYLSTKLAFELVRITDNRMTKAYAMTTACCNILAINERHELTSQFYCRNRWCQTCASIKMAIMINKYQPVLSQLEDLHFVTVTMRTIREDEIISRVQKMQSNWQKIKDNARKKFDSFTGIRKLEIKASKGKYHPHYHILVQGREQALFIVNQWLKLGGSETNIKGQDISKVWSTDKAVIELFKYATKITCSDDASNKILCSTHEMHVIFNSLYRKRIYQTFGNIKAINEEDFEIKAEIIKKAQGIYKWAGENWYHMDFGQALTDFKPSTLELNATSKNHKIKNRPQNPHS